MEIKRVVDEGNGAALEPSLGEHSASVARLDVEEEDEEQSLP